MKMKVQLAPSEQTQGTVCSTCYIQYCHVERPQWRWLASIYIFLKWGSKKIKWLPHSCKTYNSNSRVLSKSNSLPKKVEELNSIWIQFLLTFPMFYICFSEKECLLNLTTLMTSKQHFILKKKVHQSTDQQIKLSTH